MRHMRLTAALIAAIEESIAIRDLPTQVKQTRDGWAAYKGARRITRFSFSEGAARASADAWESSDVPVTFVQQ